MTCAAARADVFIECGLGEMLSGLVRAFNGRPALPTAAGGSSLKPLLHALAAAFACGRAPQLGAVLHDRFSRPFALDWQPRFFANPCELFRLADGENPARATAAAEAASGDESAWAVVRELVARRADLPVECIGLESRLLGDLHLNSLIVSQLVVDAARR